MEMPQNITVGIVQLDVKRGDVDSNLAAGLNGLHELAAGGTDMAVLPEMWTCGFDNAHLQVHAGRTPEILQTLSVFAAEHHMMIAASMPEAAREGVYNTTFLIDQDGTPAGCYRKIHLFSPTGEDDYFVAGKQAGFFQTSLGNIGILTCYDLRFPELCRCLTDRGAHLMVVSAQWPAVRVEHWDILLRARAIENQLFVVAANRCGKDGRTRFPGHSQVISPFGDVLAAADHTPGVLRAEVDYARRSAARKAIPCLKQRVFEAYHV